MSKWDALTAQEKETFLAENVMGWHVGAKGWVDAGDIPAAVWVDSYGDFQAWIKDWHPLRDITAAMGLAEAIRAKGCLVIAKLFPENMALAPILDGVPATNECRICDEESRVYHVEAATLPDAIAKCCYLALGGEE